MEKFTVKNGRELKYGFTTGTCAAAAAAASAYMLLTGQRIFETEVTLPSSEKVMLPITDIDMGKERVSCAVVKDSGDDPDVTHGMKIFAEVSLGSPGLLQAGAVTEGNLSLIGGTGIGKVTARGLKCQVGEPAINPVPRKMIFENVRRVLTMTGKEQTLTIEISAPLGEETAKKTYNPRLGIVGGISILGTTGIVDPMSEKALIDTIKAVIDKQYQENSKRILIAPGNYGRDFCREELGLDIEKAVPVSNYIGEALDYIKYKGFEEILLVGHTGKLIKLAAGIMNTHSACADGRMEVIGLHSALQGADCSMVKAITQCITTDQAFSLIEKESYFEEVKNSIMEKAMEHLDFRLKEEVKIEVIMFTGSREHILKSAGADQLTEIIRKDQNTL